MATDIPGLGKAPSSAAGRPLERMREELQILLGTRGDPLDAALTLRSAIERGLIDRIGNALGGSVTYVNTFPTTTVSGVDPTPDLTPPPTVAGLTVQAGFSQIIVQFTAPTYTQGHRNLRTEIYATKKDPSDPTLPTFTAGVTPLVTAAPGALNIVSIPSELNTRWHVWAKHQTVDGVESVAVAGGVNGYEISAGVFPTTGQDITQLMELLAGQITESELYATLGARIDLIDATSGTAGSVNARILTETTARGVALAALAAVKSRTFYSGTAPVSDGSYTLQTNDVWYNTADSNKPYVYSAGSWVASPDARVGQAVIDIAAETSNRTTAVAAEVSARESLYAGFGGAAGTDYKVFNQATTPTGTTIGDVWTWKTGGGTETFSRWNGTSWDDSLSNKRAAVYRGEYANDAALPGAGGTVIGDLARKTDTNGVVVWNGGSWVAKTSLPAPVYAFVEKETRARSDAVTAEASARDSLAVQLRGLDTGTDVTTLSAGLIYSERQARVTAVSAQASRVDLLEASVDTPSTGLLARATALETVTTDVSGGNWALASRSSVLEARVNSPSSTPGDPNYNPSYAAVAVEASARVSETGSLFAQYTVKIDTNGYVSGYGLASTATNAAPSSAFAVRADQFYIASPSGPGIAAVVPFIVRTTVTTENGVTVPIGVYMDSAYIVNVSAMYARFGTLIADSIAAGSINAAHLTLGDGSVGGDLKSTSFSEGSDTTPGAGWKLTPGGTVYASNAVIYGTIYASAGVFAGSLSAATGTFSGALSAATGSFAGDISAATGTFSGSLNVNSGGSTRMEITSSLIRGYNSGVLRFELSV